MSGDDQRPVEAVVRLLSSSDLHALDLGQEQIIDAVEDAIRREAASQVWSAPKSALTLGDGRYLMTTLSASDAPPVSVVKFVMVSPDNPKIGLPAINGSILIHDSRTGALLTVMDAKWVTAPCRFRTFQEQARGFVVWLIEAMPVKDARRAARTRSQRTSAKPLYRLPKTTVGTAKARTGLPAI